MFIVLAAALFAILASNWKRGGPVSVLAITWLIPTLMLMLHVINYEDFPEANIMFELVLLSYISCFVCGAVVFRRKRFRAMPSKGVILSDDVTVVAPLAYFCWWLGLIGTLCLWLDFAMKGSAADISDLTALHEAMLKSEGISIFGKVSNVTSWASLYCYAFALTYWGRLGLVQRWYLFLPVGGYFLGSVFNGGRQAAFQILIVSLLIYLFAPKQNFELTPKASLYKRSVKLLYLFGAVCALAAYMGYVAAARNDNAISDDKTVVLRMLFNYDMMPAINDFENMLGTKTKGLIEEGVVYFSSPIPLFKSFLASDYRNSYGVFTFPFLMRQLQPITGLSVLDTLLDKTRALEDAGAMGFGWTTAISSYIADFGLAGAGVFLFILGYYSEHVWFKARTRGRFHDWVTLVVLLLSVIYMPLIPISSDTNVFFLWVFCIVAERFGTIWRMPSRSHRRNASSRPEPI